MNTPDKQRILSTISSLLSVETPYQVETFTNPREALAYLKTQSVDLLISDYLMPEMDGITFLTAVRDLQPYAPRIILTAYADKKNAIRAINEAGLYQYLEKPWNNDDLLISVRNGLETHRLTEGLQRALAEVQELTNRLKAENVCLKEEIKLEHNFEEIISSSALFKRVLQQVEQVAVTEATVLIHGKTGTGKELIARAVHNLSHKKAGALIKVNCAAIPANLIESELFGHEKGSFTGALARKIGRFELADGGTIFLDEIGDMPLDLQAKLLRVLQEGEFERVGGIKTISINVRVIAATNRDLAKEVREGRFREDLFYRLNVFPIQLPALWERKEDIPMLVKHFTEKYGAKINRNITSISQKAVDTLMAYHWPGNVRELENIIERAVILSPGTELTFGDWLPVPDGRTPDGVNQTMESVERTHIMHVLEQTGWRVSGLTGAADILGMKSPTLVSRMKKLNITRP